MKEMKGVKWRNKETSWSMRFTRQSIIFNNGECAQST